ncbi:hypothetical protein AeRB84_000613 [Aphanomyces euteiches]|nr:hypothetical protein AeRB84_000613 [Aphanomyces euteiches]
MEFVVAFPEFGVPKVDEQKHAGSKKSSKHPRADARHVVGAHSPRHSVTLCVWPDATTGKTFAIKCIRRHDLDAKHMEFLGQEIDFLKMLNHPHIISLEAVYVDREGVYLVTEYMAGGELFDRIVEEAYYCEDEARKIVRVLLEALKYCHDQHVVHRDLKPENLFLASPTDNTTLKMGDFGFAAYAPEPTLRGTCGTPSYVAPEIIAGQPYGKPIDVWSLGVITFILLCGSPPFHGSTHIELYSSIRRGVYECPKDLSTDAQDVLAKMLVVEPTGRSTVEQLLDHPWIASDASKTPLTRTIEELHKFNMQRKFRSSVRVVLLVFLMDFFKRHAWHRSKPYTLWLAAQHPRPS